MNIKSNLLKTFFAVCIALITNNDSVMARKKKDEATMKDKSLRKMRREERKNQRKMKREERQNAKKIKKEDRKAKKQIKKDQKKSKNNK